MGFFSSITKPFKKAFSAVKDVVGGVVDTVAPVLGIGGDVASGVLNANSIQDANAANIALAREQMAYQKELAQNQVQWRVEDAKKAGLHPMAALGLSSMSYSPVSSNVMPTDYSYLGEMGQNINRAVMQGKTARERQQALDRQDQFDRIALRKANADADYAETLAASERLKLQRELFPPAPAVDGDRNLIGGQNDSPYLDKPIVSNGFRLDEKGRKIDIIPSDDAKSRTEDVFGVEWMPFIDSAKLNYMTKVLGEPFAGHWWHEKRGEFLPYPPKESKSVRQDNQNSYYYNSWRYR